MLLGTAAAVSAVPNGPYRVLVLHSFRNSLPVNTDWSRGLVRGFTSVPGLLVEIDSETLDLSRFRDANYVKGLLDIYRHKYGDRKPDLIIPTYTPAFRFLLKYGEELFPGIPIVFLGADSRFVATQELAPNITGITTHRDIAGTLELALQVNPDARRVAVIVGSGSIDKNFENDARQALQPDRAGDIIQHIRTLVTTDDSEMNPVPLYPVIAQAVQVLEPEIENWGCRVDFRPVADLPAVLVDDLQIQLVLVNLLNNALHSIKFMEDKTDKVIGIEVQRINDREVQVSVADRGPGIPPGRDADIFEPFSSDKGDGMGMGLAICRLIIEAHGGHIWYTPNPSGGAIIAFTLRLATA